MLIIPSFIIIYIEKNFYIFVNIPLFLLNIALFQGKKA